MGGKLDWPATWRFVDPRVGTTDKEVGGRERGEGSLVCARDRTKGKRCNGTIRGGLTGKADVRPPAKSLFPGERRVSTLFSSQIKPLPFIPPSSPSPCPLPFFLLESFNDGRKKTRLDVRLSFFHIFPSFELSTLSLFLALFFLFLSRHFAR